MKVTTAVRTNLDSTPARTRIVHALSHSVTSRLVIELEAELGAIRASGRADDADVRRDALALAIRRHFGTPL
jgi:hypothetical protein